MIINKAFFQGMRDGIPIALGYYAVSFSIGIIAGTTGIDAITGFFASLFTRASAGEYGVYTLIAVCASYSEVVLMCLVTNIRYLLMTTALTQKFASDVSLFKRLIAACCMTDEVFGISIAYPGYLAPSYTLGAMVCAAPLWAAGTASGIIAGDVLPFRVVSALSVALYGMFIAIIIPPAKNDRPTLYAVVASFVLSGICAFAPYLSTLSSGTRTIALTIVISAIAAYLKPIKIEDEEATDGK